MAAIIPINLLTVHFINKAVLFKINKKVILTLQLRRPFDQRRQQGRPIYDRQHCPCQHQ